MALSNPEIIIDKFLADNSSPLAVEKRRTWYAAKSNYSLFGIETCPDARVLLDDSNTVIVRDINVSGPKEPYRRLFVDDRLPEIGVVSHYSALLTKPGERPRGCGGADACWDIQTGEASHIPDPGLEGFVKRINHPDPLIQSLLSASQIAELTGKNVTAMYFDNDTCRVEPLGWFKNGGEETHLPRGMKVHDIANGEYDPRRIYANGLPSYTGHLSNLANSFLANQEDLVNKLHHQIPDLALKQAVQLPDWAVLSPSPLPVSTRYPNTFGEPGKAFVVSVPRQKAEDLTLITPKDRKIAFDQLAYALINAYNNYQSDKPFSTLNGLLVEAPSLHMADTLIKTLLHERPWARDWFDLPGRQIIMSEMTSGITHRMEYFQKSA